MSEFAAIPTTYAGVNFRSRLEARWAAMYDLLSWEWEYEPVDLNGYIPDFILSFKRPLLIEVKPVIWSIGRDGLDRLDHQREQIADTIDKIRKSTWTDEAVVVGATLHHHDEGDHEHTGPAASIGLFVDGCDASIKVCKLGFGLNDSLLGYDCRRCGCYDGNLESVSAARVQGLWREAGNRVQWRGKHVRVSP